MEIPVNQTFKCGSKELKVRECFKNDECRDCALYETVFVITLLVFHQKDQII